MKRARKILALCMAAVMMCAMSVTAFAADPPAAPGTQEVTTPGNQSIIPVTISAEATQLDVTIPTSFPTGVDPNGDVTTSGELPTITNTSYGAIAVTNITVKDNTDGDTPATWHLAAYDKDMSKEAVDSNLVGVAVAPIGGHTAADGTDWLKTTDSDTSEQVLLNGIDEKWVIDGKTDTSENDQMSITYDANVTAVSESIDNVVVANIVITVGWYKNTTPVT